MYITISREFFIAAMKKQNEDKFSDAGLNAFYSSWMDVETKTNQQFEFDPDYLINEFDEAHIKFAFQRFDVGSTDELKSVTQVVMIDTNNVIYKTTKHKKKEDQSGKEKTDHEFESVQRDNQSDESVPKQQEQT